MNAIYKENLRALFDQAVGAADPMKCLAPHLPPKPGRLFVIGAGKASARMAQALEAHYGPSRGLVITRYGYACPTRSIEIIEAAHPVPDQAGVDATQRLLQKLDQLCEEEHVIALISGGGSALLCAPKAGLSLEDKIKVNAALLASGAPIGEINILRKHLSAVKGGQLAARAFPARLTALMISDVPGDDPSLIASGPTVGGDNDKSCALDIRARWLPDFAYLDEIIRAEGAPLAATAPELAHVRNHVIATPMQSLIAAQKLARSWDIDVEILSDAIEGEAREIARAHAEMALERQQQITRPLIILSGGELTVTKRGEGIGGPNAEYALALAVALDGAPGISALAGDTDGVDGADEIAGAFIDAETLPKARALGLDPRDALDQNDAHRFFAALDDQIITGPTFTNVNDFRAMWIEPKGAL